MTTITIDHDTCEKCLSCVQICATGIYEKTDDGIALRDHVDLCVRCGHCMAACKTRSIHVEGLSYEEDFVELPDELPAADDVRDLLLARRSVRTFRKRPVSREDLEKIVEMVSTAPMSFPPQNAELTIIPDRALIEEGLPILTEQYTKLIGLLKKPFTRFIVSRKVDRMTFGTLMDHIMPLYDVQLELAAKSGEDIFTYGAPALILLHAPEEAPDHTENILIALTYAFIAAHALGLGATVLGIVPPVLNRSPELRALWKLPEGHECVASMIVGHPRIRFRRAIKRPAPAVHWL
jgi:nitroreductase/NAD-dependent dihydropyrimidine dehydrogenase PreA subunit